jgi:hypothetical protein
MSKFNSKNEFLHLNNNRDKAEVVKEKSKLIAHGSIEPHVNARELAICLDFTSYDVPGLLRRNEENTNIYMDDTFIAALSQYASTIQEITVTITFPRSYAETIEQKTTQGLAIEAFAKELKTFRQLKDLHVQFSMPNKTLNKRKLRNYGSFYRMGLTYAQGSKKWDLKMKVGNAEAWQAVDFHSPLERELFGMHRRATRPQRLAQNKKTGQQKGTKNAQQAGGSKEELEQKSSFQKDFVHLIIEP